jgi:cytochrome c-type biogenesis protein CcmH
LRVRSLLQIFLAAVGLLISVGTAPAWNPDEALKDPALEARARSISGELRCLVCQNQSIDDSDADLARDLRVLVRERLAAGDTDADVFDFVVARYGEFVLLKPRLGAKTWLLWGLPLTLLLLGSGALITSNRKRKENKGLPELTESEKEKLAKIVQAQ